MRKQIKRISMIFALLFAVLTCFAFTVTSKTFASANTQGTEVEMKAKVQTNEVTIGAVKSAYTYADTPTPIKTVKSVSANADTPTPMWFIPRERIFYSPNDDYSNLTLDPKYADYHQTSGIGGDPGLNIEYFNLRATDSTGVQKLLKPVQRVEGQNNVYTNVNDNAEDYVQLEVSQALFFQDGLSITHDSRQLKDLSGGTFNGIGNYFRIPSSNAAITMGKILYRVSPVGTQSTCEWNYMDLNTCAILDFVGSKTVEIAFVYEVKETGAWYQIPKYHHFIALYYINIV